MHYTWHIAMHYVWPGWPFMLMANCKDLILKLTGPQAVKLLPHSFPNCLPAGVRLGSGDLEMFKPHIQTMMTMAVK